MPASLTEISFRQHPADEANLPVKPIGPANLPKRSTSALRAYAARVGTL